MAAPMLAVAVIAVPALAALVLALVASAGIAHRLNLGATIATLALTCLLPAHRAAGVWLLVDPLATHLAVLAAFVALCLAAGERASGRYGPALFQAMLAATLLALLANPIGLTWLALDMAVLAGLASGRASGSAMQGGFALGAAGLALAAFGTVVLALAVAPGAPANALMLLRWSALPAAAGHASAPLLSLAFVLLLAGYGTLAGLAPAGGWPPKAPVLASGIAAGGVMNAALAVLVRLRGVVDANPAALPAGPLLIGFGLATLLLAAAGLWRRRAAARLVAGSTAAHTGIIVFAFGLGGPLASFAALLHLTMHTLVRTALAQCMAQARRLRDGDGLGGLLAGHRALGLALAAALVAAALLPPFGLFATLFLIVTATARQAPALLVPLALGLVLLAGALCRQLATMGGGGRAPAPPPRADRRVLLPAWLQLALAGWLGLAMPGGLLMWFAAVAASLR